MVPQKCKKKKKKKMADMFCIVEWPLLPKVLLNDCDNKI